MPSGKMHDKISISFLPLFIIGMIWIGLSLEVIIIISLSYLFSSYMFNGDLDVYSQTYNRWLFIKWLWLPYQKIFPHRSIFSHGFIIGTIIRVIYISIIPAIILYSNGYSFSIFLSDEIIYVLIGLELGSALHTICDYSF